jgi:type VI secretion system protein ImpK
MTPAANAASAPNLATCYQEILTVTARLRTRKFAVTDSTSFRTQVRKALQLAESSAQSLRYEQEDVRLGSYAVIALLDETIYNSSSPAFRDWAQKPLMLDLYGTLNAGEGFFENLSSILKRREMRATIDLLEVYLLCLMLGFRGRYSSGSGEQLHLWRDPMLEKILRNRGAGDRVALSRNWLPQAPIELPVASNRWTSLVVSSAIACFVVCVVLFGLYSLLLSRGAGELAATVVR